VAWGRGRPIASWRDPHAPSGPERRRSSQCHDHRRNAGADARSPIRNASP
jgi:hypothetical protein